MTMIRYLNQAAVTAALLTAAAASANADCGIHKSSNAAAYQSAVKSFARIKAESQAAQTRQPRDSSATPSIVGLWHTIFLVDPNGGYYTAGPNVFDEGFDQWHSDGTETLNDISAPPTGNVCLGVWAQTGPLTYQLKHPTWIFDPSNTTLIGIGTISEQVTLDPAGNTYTGTSAFDFIDLMGNHQGPETATIMAERIVADGQLFAPTLNQGATTTAVLSPTTLSTSQPSVVLDASASTSASGALTYSFSVLPGGKTPAILQSENNPKATVEFVNGPGTYLVQLKVTDEAGTSAVAQATLMYTGM